MGSSLRAVATVILTLLTSASLCADATFFRGLNLNGPALVIDGHPWQGQESPDYRCDDRAFEAQQITLLPSTDADRAKMIRSSRWGGNRVELIHVPAGRYSVFLYVWEDNHSESYEIAVNGATVLQGYRSGKAGQWQRLGPWYTDAVEGSIVITSKGGAANFSGVELWQGEHDGTKPPEFSEEQLAFFENRIRPLLAEHCYECHSEQAAAAEGKLLVDSAPTLRLGGSRGPAVTPGDLEQSLLIEAVRHTNDQLRMPPEEQLPQEAIAALEQWVREGAADPRRSPTRVATATIDLDKAREFWSFRPVIDSAPPDVGDATWSRTPIDRFVQSQLEARQLRPLGIADKRTRIRRAAYDLTGLPPSREEIEAFLRDESPAAWSRVIERLLASPHYGERWGRHWMDLVRYADTAGENSDYPIPQAYRYRNYIIDSFNADKPYDQFLREQIAGDLLPADSDQQRNTQIVATGYIAIARRFGSVIENYPQHLTIEDTIDNLGRVMLGMTLSCSRCHDHKFDPVTQTDYYGLYGIFASTRYAFPGIELDKKPRDFTPLIENGKPGRELAYAVSDAAAVDAHVHVRGEPEQPGDLVPRKFLEILGGQRLSDDQASQSGRRQLADWVTDPQNPLTARVMVNRIWQHHFGAGLVRTPSDFGARGQPPTHPQLLDWLAARFIQSGWSVKQMHRLMMNSRVYQLSSIELPEQRIHELEGALASEVADAFRVDPNNELLWRFQRRRLDAESLRDSLMQLSGNLDESPMTEPHPFPPADKWEFTQHHPFRDSYDSRRRSVYLMTARLNARPYFTTFDGADRNASTATRDSSVTTVQSLYLLNNEFFHQQASGFADALIRDCTSDDERIRMAFERATARRPSNEEYVSAQDFVNQMRVRMDSSGVPREEQAHELWTALARAILRTNAFLYVD
jgi:hypothetical protein